MKKDLKDNLLSNVFMYFTIFIFFLISVIFLVKNNIILFLLAFLVVTIISLKANIKKFPLFLFVASFVIRLVAIKLLNFPPVSDFETLLKAANKFVNHDYSFQSTKYFSMWAYQTGFVIYEGVILKIFKSVFALKVLNALYSSSLVLLIYFFGRKICSEKSAKTAALLYMIFPFPLYLNSVLANHHLSAFLMYIGIFFLLKDNKKIKDYVFAGILISLGNIIRPEGIIVVFSYILYEVFKLNKKTLLQTAKNVGIFVIIYFLVGFSSSFLVQKTNINKEGLTNNNPLWKFVLGFNHEACGYYNEKDDIKYLGNKDLEIKVIKDRIFVSPIKMGKLFTCKTNRFWLQSNISSKNDMYSSKSYNVLGMKVNFSDVEKIVVKFNSLLYIVTFFMCIIGVTFNRKKIIKDKAFFFVIMMIVTFGVYLLIEIQPRYAYFIHVSIFILSVYGYDYILDKISKINLKKLKKTL